MAVVDTQAEAAVLWGPRGPRAEVIGYMFAGRIANAHNNFFGGSMVSVLRRITLIAVALLAVTTSVEAQRFGPQVSWGSESDLGVGVRGEFNLAGKLSQTGPFSQAFVIAAFDYFFIDCDPAECTYWELNPSLAIPIGPTERNMYVGAGLNYTSFTSSFGGFDFSDTNTGLNVLGGMKFSLGSLPAFAEARFSLGGGEQLVLSFGMLFGGNP